MRHFIYSALIALVVFIGYVCLMHNLKTFPDGDVQKIEIIEDCFSFESCELLEARKIEVTSNKETNWIINIGEKYGTFGDSFGAVTSFCTLLLFILSFLSYKNQQEQIDSIKKDKNDEFSKEIIDVSKKIFSEVLCRQFDINSILYNIFNYKESEKTKKILIENLDKELKENPDFKIYFDAIYFNFHKVLKILDVNGMKNNEIILIYFNLVFMSSLSFRELSILFLIGLKDQEVKKFIEDYGILAGLDDCTYPTIEGLKNFKHFYKDSAYNNLVK